MAIKIKKSIFMAIKNMLYDNTNFNGHELLIKSNLMAMKKFN